MVYNVSFYTTGDSIPSDLEVSVTASYTTDSGQLKKIWVYFRVLQKVIAVRVYALLKHQYILQCKCN